VKKIVIHSDGGCHGNPGPGGWAAVLAYGKHIRELKGGVSATTNNRMELQAAIEALRILKEPCHIDFHTDSQYVRQGISQWITGWKRNGWRTSSKQPVKNADLWRELDAATARHKIEWHWVKGHAGHADNERCDELANEAIAAVKASHTPQQLKALLEDFKAETEAQS
jgi:ribonuclease HI